MANRMSGEELFRDGDMPFAAFNPKAWYAADDDEGSDADVDEEWDDTAADEQSEEHDDRGSDPEPVQR
jgi:hypothetical protein